MSLNTSMSIGSVAGLGFWMLDRFNRKKVVSSLPLIIVGVTMLMFESEAIFRAIVQTSIHWTSDHLFQGADISLQYHKGRIAPICTTFVAGIFHLYFYPCTPRRFNLFKAVALGLLLGGLQENIWHDLFPLCPLCHQQFCF